MSTAAAEIQRSMGAGLPGVLGRSVRDVGKDPTQTDKGIVDQVLNEAKKIGKDILPKPINDAIDAMQEVLPPELKDLAQYGQDRLNEAIQKEIDKALGIQESQISSVGEMAILGGMVLTLVQNEGASYQNTITTHPVQHKKNISDHSWLEQDKFSVAGIFSAGNEVSSKHKELYAQLKQLRDDNEPLKFIWDHPPGTLENVMIADLRYARQSPVRKKFDYELDLVRVELVESQDPQTGTDPTTGSTIPGTGTNAGKQEPKKDDGGGLFGFLKDAWESVSGLANSEVGKMVRNTLAGLAEKLPIGGDLISNVLKGDFSLPGIASSLLSLVPGGGLLSDVAQAGLKTLEDGNFSLGELAGNFLQQSAEGSLLGSALDLVGNIPGGDAVINQVFQGNFDPASLASAFLGGFVEEIGGSDSLLGDASKIVGGYLKEAAFDN